MKTTALRYHPVTACPLCGGSAKEKAKLQRNTYYFGDCAIPLPATGVSLCECQQCSLLFKNQVPDRQQMGKIMFSEATGVWQAKPGPHPAVAWIKPYIVEPCQGILDIGASNGDLLDQLKPFTSRLSALDVVVYPRCKTIVNTAHGEYIVGEVEGHLHWSGQAYDLVTAFDIYEHFLDTQRAVANIAGLVRTGGKLVIETGDWTFIPETDLGKWYYANLFEHQIFWNRKAFNHMCAQLGFQVLEYRQANHKNRRDIGTAKRLALETVVAFSRFPPFKAAMLAAGKGDPTRFAKPTLQDHAFVVLQKN